MRRLFSIALTLLFCASLSWSQSAPPTNMPKKPKDLMLLAAQVNGLQGIDHPWHVKANYQTFDPDGKPKNEGVFEEWWVAPNKYKISYAGPEFHQTEYRNGDKDWIAGDAGAVPAPESMVEQFLVHPLPEAREIHGRNFIHINRKMGTDTLTCVQVTNSLLDNPPPTAGEHIDIRVYASLRYISWSGVGRMTCFDTKIPSVRGEALDGELYVVFNNVAEANGHYIAEDIWVKNSGLAVIHASSVALDFPPEIRDADIAPPASAVAVPAGTPKGLVYGRKIRGQDPRYPAEAKKSWMRGTVMLRAVISKTGDIDDLQIVSGPVEFRSSTSDYVKTWKFKPYLLNGQPIDVGILVDVSYIPQR